VAGSSLPGPRLQFSLGKLRSFAPNSRLHFTCRQGLRANLQSVPRPHDVALQQSMKECVTQPPLLQAATHLQGQFRSQDS